MIKKNNAFVLISYPYKTSNLITQFLTDEEIVGAVSYGSKKDSKNFGSDLNSVSKLSIVCYQNTTQGLNTLKESSVIKNYIDIERNTYSLFALYYVREIILNIAKDFDRRYFLLMEKMLDALSENILINNGNETILKEYIQLLLRAFEIKAIHIVGISPQFSSCACCNKVFDRYIFSISDSYLVCSNCLSNISNIEDTYTIDKEDIEFFNIIKYSSLSDILKIDTSKYSKTTNKKSYQIFSKLLFNHTGNILRSKDLLDEIF